ncbi:sigma-70 family RNA polymerase sigma factor [Streptomyces sp. NPDC079167]|uniref:RNA polymerase sigma factor n=1 Tax=Streptomyces sp. NPDC079167 TaxID=3154513 RepID=UPI00342C1AEF
MDELMKPEPEPVSTSKWLEENAMRIDGFYRRRESNPQVAQDLAQEARLKIWEKKEVMENHPNPPAWAWRVISNILFSHYRDKYGQKASFFDTEVEPPPDGRLGVAEDSEIRALLRPAVNALPERQRMVVWLLYYEDFSTIEVSEQMGITVAVVRRYHYLARNKLRNHLLDAGLEGLEGDGEH